MSMIWIDSLVWILIADLWNLLRNIHSAAIFSLQTVNTNLGIDLWFLINRSYKRLSFCFHFISSIYFLLYFFLFVLLLYHFYYIWCTLYCNKFSTDAFKSWRCSFFLGFFVLYRFYFHSSIQFDSIFASLRYDSVWFGFYLSASFLSLWFVMIFVCVCVAVVVYCHCV